MFDFNLLLINQIKKIDKKNGGDIKITLCIGGLPIEDDKNAIKNTVQIVVGTVGRIN